MDTYVNQDRIAQLNLDGYTMGRPIVFCEKCDFQYPPETLGSCYCPNCRVQMRPITLGPELVAMNRRKPSYTGSDFATPNPRT